MALQPSKFVGQERLQPGARGEMFQVNYPGYRDGVDRINRTNNRLSTNQHDVPNIKYEFDRRLPVLFKYGYAFGYNQMVIPKGRIVAVDPHMDLIDFESRKAHNTLTIANGGVPVEVRNEDTVTDFKALVDDSSETIVSKEYADNIPTIGKEWAPVAGYASTYHNKKLMRPFKDGKTAKAILKEAGLEIDAVSGKVKDTQSGLVVNNVRPGNIPIGVMQRNEYTRNDDAYNGMMPGSVLTDAMVEFPWFLHKDKAEQNPWGSAYGGLYVGALVKSDENGRIVLSPLSALEDCTDMTAIEMELERQQVIGQVYEVKKDLVPEGAAKYAQWALSDILRFEEFNPDIYRQNNRDGEDSISQSPYNSSGEYPGYPYDMAIHNNDLHMLEAYRGQYDQRMQHEYRFDYGIPGLTDGFNAYKERKTDKSVGVIGYPGVGTDYVDMFFRTNEVSLEPGSLSIKIGDGAFTACTVGQKLPAKLGDAEGTFLTVKYANELQGIVVLEVKPEDKTAADEFFAALKPNQEQFLNVGFTYIKRGKSGVPTYLDWDGCIGSCKILFQK